MVAWKGASSKLPSRPTPANLVVQFGAQLQLDFADPDPNPTSNQHQALTGLNSTSFAMPGMPMMLMAWSMPPLVTPTYRSAAAVNSATSCGGSQGWAAGQAGGCIG